MVEQFEREIGGKTLQIETGKLAGLADGAVTIRYGDTMLLVTSVMKNKPPEGTDFSPLTIHFDDRMDPAGKIPCASFPHHGCPRARPRGAVGSGRRLCIRRRAVGPGGPGCRL